MAATLRLLYSVSKPGKYEILSDYIIIYVNMVIIQALKKFMSTPLTLLCFRRLA